MILVFGVSRLAPNRAYDRVSLDPAPYDAPVRKVRSARTPAGMKAISSNPDAIAISAMSAKKTGCDNSDQKIPSQPDSKIDSAPPFAHAGNMDNKELVAGTTLYMPVAAKGALFEAGDGHAGQGNGEVDIEALETYLRAPFASSCTRTAI